MSKWPIRYKFWHWANYVTAKLAWKYADPGGEAWGKALRIDHSKFLWRLNKWVGGRWIPWWMENRKKFTAPKGDSK